MPSPPPSVHEQCFPDNGYTAELDDFFPENVVLEVSTNEQFYNDLFAQASLLVRIHSILLTDTIPRIRLTIYNHSILTLL